MSSRKLKKLKFQRRQVKRVARREVHQKEVHAQLRKLGGYLSRHWKARNSRLTRKIEKKLLKTQQRLTGNKQEIKLIES